MLRSQKAIVVVFLSALVVGCVSPPQTGIISATWTPPGKPPEPVVISWESEDTITGPMYVTLGKGGERFTAMPRTCGGEITNIWNQENASV